MSAEPVRKSTDHIKKRILLRAPRGRVWRALTDSVEFGTWFGMKFAAPFTPGATVRAVIVGTKVNPDVAKMQKQYEGISCDIIIDRIEPGRVFSFRWDPGAGEPGYD